MPTDTPKPAFARRGLTTDRYGVTRETTFVSKDRADNIVRGWFHGYVEDGAVWNGCVLTHVDEPSWRVPAASMPVAASIAKAA